VQQDRLSSILFVCGRNSVRSPMARAITEQRFPRRFYTASAGLAPGDRDPFVDAVLVGLEDLDDLNFDLVVTLSPLAHHHMLELTRGQETVVEYWATPDPTLATGSREQILSAYRDLRERLLVRIVERLERVGR
jgi:protein-tyrosine-phosphatase